MHIWILYYEKKAPASIFLRQRKSIVDDDFSVCLLNTKSCYHGLNWYNFCNPPQKQFTDYGIDQRTEAKQKHGVRCPIISANLSLPRPKKNTAHLLIQLKFALKSNDPNFIRLKGCIWSLSYLMPGLPYNGIQHI